MHANKQNAIDYIEAGDIGAAVGFKSIKTGDTLSDEKHPIVLESMDFPEIIVCPEASSVRIYGLSRSSNWYCG